MANPNILKSCMGKKALQYILQANTFSEEEYLMLVTNQNVKQTEYLVPLIKYKFNLDPTPNLLKNCSWAWKYAIHDHLKINPNNIEDYLHYDDDCLSKCIDSVSLNHNYILDLLFEKKYYKTIVNIFQRCSVSCDKELLDKCKDNNISLIKLDTKFQFVSDEVLQYYLLLSKYMTSKCITNNSHLLKSESDFDKLIDFLKVYECHVDLDDSFLKQSKKHIFRLLLLSDGINLERYYDKFYKFPELWNEIDLSKLELSYRNRYYDGLGSILSSTDTVFDNIKKFLIRIDTTHHGYTRMNFKLTNKPDILLYFDILIFKKMLDLKHLVQIKTHLEKEKQSTQNQLIKTVCDKLINIVDKYIKQQNKDDQPIIRKNDLPILID
jgi:hypothetical protein